MKDWVLYICAGLIVIALSRINRRLTHMATQEQVDLLVNNLESISTNVAGIASDQAELVRLLEEANQNSNVDLTAALELANDLAERTTTLDAAFPAQPPADPTSGDDSIPAGGGQDSVLPAPEDTVNSGTGVE